MSDSQADHPYLGHTELPKQDGTEAYYGRFSKDLNYYTIWATSLRDAYDQLRVYQQDNGIGGVITLVTKVDADGLYPGMHPGVDRILQGGLYPGIHPGVDRILQGGSILRTKRSLVPDPKRSAAYYTVCYNDSEHPYTVGGYSLEDVLEWSSALNNAPRDTGEVVYVAREESIGLYGNQFEITDPNYQVAE